MKNLFKNFKLNTFGIIFIILCLAAFAPWFVPSGEYIYQCSNGEAYIYENSEGKDTAVCPISEEELNSFIIMEKQNPDELAAFIEESVVTNPREDAVYTYQESEPKRQGIWDVIQAPVDGFIAAIEIIVFVFAIGGFINIIIESGAMDSGIYALLNKFRGKEIMLIPILMILFGLGGTTFGMAEETIVFYAILIPVLFRAGFDNAVGMMTICLGAGVGTLCSTVNPFAIGVASTAVGLSPGDGIISRILLFVILIGISIAYVMWYAKRVKKDPTKSICYDRYEELKQEFSSTETESEMKKMTGAHKAILVVFATTFIAMVLSVIPWEKAFNVTLFEDLANGVNSLAIPFFGGDSGILAFGHWYFVEMSALFLLGSFIAGCIAKGSGLIKENLLNTFIAGSKDMLSVAFIIGLARGIQIILESSGMAPTILYYGSQLLSGLPEGIFSILTYLFYIPLSFLIPSTSGLATATMPIVGDLAYNVFGSTNGQIEAITAYASASGLVNLITPTSGVVMGALAIAKMDYGKWVKVISPLLVIIFVLTIAFLWLTTTFGFFA